MSTILVIGIKESARVNNLIVILKVAIVLLIVGVGLGHINTANWTPLIPPNTGEWGTFGPSGILRAAGLVFFAYIGFDAVSTAAQEAKQPAAGHADRHPRLARHLHLPLRRSCRRC